MAMARLRLGGGWIYFHVVLECYRRSRGELDGEGCHEARRAWLLRYMSLQVGNQSYRSTRGWSTG